MQLKALFITLATRAGVPATDAKLLEAAAAIPEFDVDDDSVATPIKTNLITESEAVAKPTIKNKFTAEALNGIDALVDPILGEIFDADELETFKTENKATTKKISKLVAKAKELKGSSKPSDQAALHKTITELNEAVAKAKTDHQEELRKKDEEHTKALASKDTEYETKLFFNGLANDVLVRPDVVEYAKAKKGKRVIDDLKDTLETVGGILDIKTGKVMTREDQTLPLYIDNKPVTAESLLEKTLVENKYIKVSEGPAASATVAVPGGGGGGTGDAKELTEAQKKNAARLGAGSTS